MGFHGIQHPLAGLEQNLRVSETTRLVIIKSSISHYIPRVDDELLNLRWNIHRKSHLKYLKHHK